MPLFFLMEDRAKCKSSRKWGTFLIIIHLGVAKNDSFDMVQAAYNFRSQANYPLRSEQTSLKKRVKVRRRIPLRLCVGFGIHHLKIKYQ